MTLHFAYGANMSRTGMRRHAPGARALGAAKLDGHRFVITCDGYATVIPDKSRSVYGVLWKITPRDRVMLDAWENVSAALYRAATLPVRTASGLAPALVYVARPLPIGKPRVGYIDLVVQAAQSANLPGDYIDSLRQWARPGGMGSFKIGDGP